MALMALGCAGDENVRPEDGTTVQMSTEAASDAPSPTQARGALDSVGSRLMFDSPPELAFKAGFHGDENIWLRLQDGQLRRVTDWELDARYAACSKGWSTAGYFEGAGRFGPLHFEPRSRRILFAERVACWDEGREQDARVLELDLASGTTRVVLDQLPLLPPLAAGAGVVVVRIDRTRGEAGAPAMESHPAGIFELGDGALKPLLPLTENDSYYRGFERRAGEILEWNAGVLLLIEGVPMLELRGGTWRFSNVLSQLPNTRPVVSVSPSRTHLCATTSSRQGWVFGADSSAMVPTEARGCHWSPSGDRVAFGSDLFAVATGQELEPIPGATLAGFSAAGTWRDQLVGIQDGRVVGIHWTTLERTTLLAPERMPTLCGGSAVRLQLPPDGRPYAILRESCGCIDCDVSGSMVLQLESMTTQPIEVPVGGHEINHHAFLPDGSALVMSAQKVSSDIFEPAPGSHFAISAQGTVTLSAPPPGLTGVLHDPVALQ